MKENNIQDTPDYGQPVAYDTEGRPLYLHPTAAEDPTPVRPSHVTAQPTEIEGNNFNPQIRAQYANEPSVVHAARPIDPVVAKPSVALLRKSEESKRLFPQLNISEGEFVILRIQRHPIGLLLPILITAIVIVVISVLAFLVPDFYASPEGMQLATTTPLPSAAAVVGGLLLLGFLVLCIGAVAVWIYLKNQFYLTNEAVIQEVQQSLFSRYEQTVSLGSIEDASFKQQGILQHIFNYGTMRLSTEGEETTYRFAFVEDPKAQIATVNDAVEAFKNGRPVGSEFLD
jgi:hypothetical protein